MAFSVSAAMAALLLTSPNVDLRGCSVALSPALSGNAFYAFRRIDGISVSFVNKGPAPLAEVTFIVRYGGDTETVTDRGVFSPGIRIDHQLGALQSEPYAGKEVFCEVSTAVTQLENVR